MAVDYPRFSGRLEEEELPGLRLRWCEVVLRRSPAAGACKDIADAVGQRIVVEGWHAEEALGEFGDHAS